MPAVANVMPRPIILPDNLDIKRKRLYYQSQHRGVREMDIFLGTFAEKYLAGFSGNELELYDKFLNESDQDIYDWVTGREALPAFHDNKVTALLINFKPA